MAKVVCPKCGRKYVVTSKGKIHRHYVDATTRLGTTTRRMCWGSGMKADQPEKEQ